MTCRNCGELPDTDFAPSQLTMISPKNGKPYRRNSGLCRKCQREKNQRYYNSHPERRDELREQMREKRAKG